MPEVRGVGVGVMVGPGRRVQFRRPRPSRGRDRRTNSETASRKEWAVVPGLPGADDPWFGLGIPVIPSPDPDTPGGGSIVEPDITIKDKHCLGEGIYSKKAVEHVRRKTKCEEAKCPTGYEVKKEVFDAGNCTLKGRCTCVRTEDLGEKKVDDVDGGLPWG